LLFDESFVLLLGEVGMYFFMDGLLYFKELQVFEEVFKQEGSTFESAGKGENLLRAGVVDEGRGDIVDEEVWILHVGDHHMHF